MYQLSGHLVPEFLSRVSIHLYSLRKSSKEENKQQQSNNKQTLTKQTGINAS